MSWTRYGLAVLVGPGLLGVERQDRLGLQGAQKCDRRGVHRKLHGCPPSRLFRTTAIAGKGAGRWN
jgi:hypothetical protein